MSQDKSVWMRGLFLFALLSSAIIMCNEAFAQSRLIISQYVETTSGRSPKGIELWNTSASTIDFSVDTLVIMLGRNGDTLKTDVTVGSGTLQGGSVMVIGTADLQSYLSDQGLSNVYFVEKAFTFNGNDAIQIQLGGTIEDTFGNPGEDPGSSWDGNGVSTKNSNIELKTGITTGSVDGFTDPSTRFQTVSTDNSLTGFGLPPGGKSVNNPKPEPSEAAQFGTPDINPQSITLHWTDAGGVVPPDGYLVKLSDTSPESIDEPADGVPEGGDVDASDGKAAIVVAQGTESLTINGLVAHKTYYFKMFSFTNSGSDIDYKTDLYASASVTTSSGNAGGSGSLINAWINEFHYDNKGPDTNEFVEVVADTSIDLSKLDLLLYNGSNGKVYNTANLSAFTPGEILGRWHFYSKEYSSIQNGPDGMALVYHFSDRDTVLQFISYEGTFIAADGPAGGLTGSLIDTSESSQTDTSRSLGLSGLMTDKDDNNAIWIPMVATPGRMNDLESVSITNDTVVSRKVIMGDMGWRMLSTPVAGITYADLQQNTPIQGYSGSTAGSDKNLYTGYDGSGWTYPADLSEPMMSGHGFILYFFDNNSNGSRKLPIDFDLTGKLPGTPVTVPLHANGDEFNLVGNPFPAYIDMNSMVVNGGSLASDVAQIWDDQTGSYILSTELDNRIAPYQGFFIQNNNAQSVTFMTAGFTNKTIAREVSSKQGDYALLGFQVEDADTTQQGKILDRATALYFSNDSDTGWDKWDIQKLMPLTQDYAILGIKGTRDGSPVLKAEESRPLTLDTPLTFELTISGTGAKGKKILRWPVWKNVPAAWGISLEDLVTKQVVNMRTDSLYRFVVNKTESQTGDVSGYFSGISSVRVAGSADARFKVTITPTITDVVHSPEKPLQVRMEHNYPNPFNPTTAIKFFLPKATMVSLTVYDILGRRVAVLVDGNTTKGWHTVNWSAHNISSGVYFYRLKTAGKVLVRKMLLIK